MAKTKKERRCEIVHEELRTYISPIMVRAIDKITAKGETPDEGMLNGIIRDKVAFFIAEHYGVPFQMVRNYHAPNQLMVKAVKDFVDRQIPYTEIKTFYLENKELFKQRNQEIAEPPLNRRVLIRDVESSKFLRLEADGPVWVDQINASAFDLFHSKELTRDVVVHRLYGEGEDLQRYDANMVMEKAERWYHSPVL